MRSPVHLLWLAIAASTVLSASNPLVAAQSMPLRYAQSYSAILSIFSLPISVAERAGFFRRERLDFRVVVPLPGGSDNMIDALNDGSADLTHIATPFLVRGALAGSDAVAIAAEFNNPIYSLVVKPEIKSFADLRGKLVGLADEAGTITMSTRKLLTLRGLRQEDFRVKIMEGTPARYNCLRRGECDAVPLGQPQDLLALKKGIGCSDSRLKPCPSLSILSPPHGAPEPRHTKILCAMCAPLAPRSSSSAIRLIVPQP